MAKNYGKISEIVNKYPKTDFWMDSLTGSDIDFALEHGACGVATSPVCTASTLELELSMWKKTVEDLVKENPGASEKEIFWMWNNKVVAERAKPLMKFYDPDGYNGRFGIQANIYDYNNPDRMLAQAKKIHSIAPNTVIKIPTTKAGLQVMEEAVADGCNTMGTSSASVSQIVAAAEAQERGLNRRKEAGLDCSGIFVGCALQLTIQDILNREYAEENNIDIDENVYCWGSIAVGKKAYKIIKERGCRARMVTSYYSCMEHITEFIGADVIMAIELDWMKELGLSDIEVRNYIDDPVSEAYIDELSEIPLFVQAYEENGLTPDEFQNFAPVRRMFHSFANEYDKGVRIIREIMLPWDIGASD